ncbi:MAG: DUF3859 domain-containing protein [Bacteroidales bacterium]|jgi:hypothetical protein|nr:DUF3859 domain-containing protein [Bacteroidales bacterium]
MRLEEREPKYIIDYNPEDVGTIRTALKQYTDIIESGKAFKDDYMVVGFKPEMDRISLSFFDDVDVLKRHIIKSCYGCSDISEADNLIDHIFTETLFFLCATKYPELEQDLKSACEVIVAFAQDTGDSSCMWINCEMPFGVEPLHVIATVHPEYGYLLASFFIQNWDDEHMSLPLFILADWAGKIGVNRNTIKAFCYCDNSRAREMMLGYDTWDGISEDTEVSEEFGLVKYLRNTSGAMAKFVNQLVERCKERPLTDDSYGYGYDDYIEDPVTIIAIQMLLSVEPCDTMDDDFDIDEFLIKRLIHKSAELEIEEINRLIQETVSVSDEEYEDETENDKENSGGTADIDMWRVFIQSALKRGSEIWAYIISGDNSDILQHIEKQNILRLAEDGDYDLYDNVLEDAYDLDDLMKDLDTILNGLFLELSSPKLLKTLGYELNCNETILRFTDVIFRLMGEATFHDDYIDYITERNHICTIEEFNTRYAVNWKTQFNDAIKEFQGYRSVVTRKHLDRCMKLINDNRDEAKTHLTDTIFVINENDDNDYLVTRKKRSVEDTLCIAMYLLITDAQNAIDDAITNAAETYIEHYGTERVLSDIQQSSTIPDDSLMQSLEEGALDYMSSKDRESYRIKYNDWLEYKNYIINGSFLSSPELSVAESEQKAFDIIYKYLEKDKGAVSDKQKTIDWLTDHKDITHKLLLFSHMLCCTNGLKCHSAISRSLRIAFKAAPVRVSHMIGKFYSNNNNSFENYSDITTMLETLHHQGLSAEGYCGYLLEQLNKTEYIQGKEQYQLFIKTLFDPDSNTDPQQQAIVKGGFELLKYETQLDIVNDAKKELTDINFDAIYSEFFIQRFKRYLEGEYIIKDAPIYFYKRLEYENIYCKYVNWTEWGRNKDLLSRILTEVETGIDLQISPEECRQAVYDHKGWGYIVLQETDDKLIPVLGNERVALLQKGFNKDDIDQSHTHAVIIDKSCPKENIDELFYLLGEDHKKLFRDSILNYLYGSEEIGNVKYYLSCGVDDNPYGLANYNDYTIDRAIKYLNDRQKFLAFNAMALISPEFLNSRTNMSPRDYFNQLMDFGIDRYAIFKYLMSKNDMMLISTLALKIDISPYIVKEKIQQRMNLLSVVSNYAQYHKFVLSQEKSRSEKLKRHVNMLIDKFKLKEPKPDLFKISDYGLYNMSSATDTNNGAAKKIADEIKHIEETDKIKAEKGALFGLRFTATDQDKEPEIIEHTVIVTHPQKDSCGTLYINKSQWRQNGYSNTDIFMGWMFQDANEIIPGTYNIAAYDNRGKMLINKDFIVE